MMEKKEEGKSLEQIENKGVQKVQIIFITCCNESGGYSSQQQRRILSSISFVGATCL